MNLDMMFNATNPVSCYVWGMDYVLTFLTIIAATQAMMLLFFIKMRFK